MSQFWTADEILNSGQISLLRQYDPSRQYLDNPIITTDLQSNIYYRLDAYLSSNNLLYIDTYQLYVLMPHSLAVGIVDNIVRSGRRKLERYNTGLNSVNVITLEGNEIITSNEPLYLVEVIINRPFFVGPSYTF